MRFKVNKILLKNVFYHCCKLYCVGSAVAFNCGGADAAQGL